MNRLDQPFGPDLVAGFAGAFPAQSRFVVAFSGGADSLALLHAFAAAGARDPSIRLCAVHVDHHLHPDSTRWAHRCRNVCHRLAVELMVLSAELKPGDAMHTDEATARTARYAAFERILLADDVLCTAHSRDDHAETVLLNLLRGGGARGLAGIPPRRRLGPGTVARPALGVSRAALHAYARGTGIEPIRDPANEDSRFSRVLLRRKVMPALEERWPGLRSTLARVAERGRESTGLLDALAAIDLKPAGGIGGESLDVTVVGALDPARRRNAVAGWLRARGIASPGARRIEQIARNLVEARRDAMPCIRLGDMEVRRFRGRIRLISRVTPVAAQVVCDWRIPEPLALDHGGLAWESSSGGGLDDAVGDTRFTVRVRGDDAGWMRGPEGRGRSLKKRFQSLGIPPWERGRIPLVYSGDVLAAIGSVWINPRLAARPGAPGWRVRWTPRR